MFDVGFSELVVIGLVALIVIGPERMPTVARTLGALLGRMQRYVGDVKSEIKREMQLDDLKKIQSQVTEQIQSIEGAVKSELRSAEDVARSTIDDVRSEVEGAHIEGSQVDSSVAQTDLAAPHPETAVLPAEAPLADVSSTAATESVPVSIPATAKSQA